MSFWSWASLRWWPQSGDMNKQNRLKLSELDRCELHFGEVVAESHLQQILQMLIFQTHKF